jgi:hypothetical protein
VDAIMQTLEDHPQEVQNAIRAALERGVKATEVLDKLQQESDEDAFIKELATATKAYPGLTQEDVHAIIAKTAEIGKTNPALADALSIEEIMVRTFGREKLDARRTKTPAPSKGAPKGDPPAPGGKGKPAAAEIIGDATPGATGANVYVPTPGNDFSDLGRQIYAEAGESLVIRK